MTRRSELWHKCASVGETLWWLLCNAPNLHILLLLWSPSMWMLLAARLFENDDKGTHAVCSWEEPDHMRAPEPGCPFNRGVLETPSHSGWPTFYAFLGVTFVFGLTVYRNNPRRLMQVTFWLHFLIATTIRCLSTFSGWTTQPAWSSLIWNSNSPGYVCWLWLLVECRCWNWTYLGFYDDFYFHEATRTVYNQSGKPVWRFTSEDTLDELYSPYSLMFRPWRDIAARLSYIYLIDNTIHVIWLRYFHVDAPYTAYINNSEILTILLFVSLTVYTYTRMRTHVYFDNAVTGPLVDIKSTVLLPIRSVSRDLFTFASPHHLFRTASKSRHIFMIFMCLLTTATIATWELSPWVSYFWDVIRYLVAAIIVKVFKDSWREYRKMCEAEKPTTQPLEQVKIHGGVISEM